MPIPVLCLCLYLRKKKTPQRSLLARLATLDETFGTELIQRSLTGHERTTFIFYRETIQLKLKQSTPFLFDANL